MSTAYTIDSIKKLFYGFIWAALRRRPNFLALCQELGWYSLEYRPLLGFGTFLCLIEMITFFF